MSIKPIPKPKKKQKLSTLRNKCDRALQEAVRQVYDSCLVCGGELSCGHHYWPKSMSNTLRYDWENIIPLCAGCHLQHHSGNPDIHEQVLRIKGQKWMNDLKGKRLKITKVSKGYYQKVLENLKLIVDN